MNATYVHSLQQATDETNLDAVEELLREQQAIGGEVFRVPVVRLAKMQEKLAKLNRKATKLDTAPITLTDTGERDESEVTLHGIKRTVEYAFVAVSGRTPVLNGWAFTATVEHTTDGNLIHTLPAYARHRVGQVVDLSAFRSTGRICQHCDTNRRRLDTYLVQNEDTGEVKQVGSSCLADFTGVNNPKAIAKWFEALYEWSRWIGGGYSNEPFEAEEFDINGFMATACAVVRNFGYASRKTAQENDTLATVQRVKDAFLYGDYVDYGVEQEDYDKAQAVILHVRNVLAPAARGDYEQNVVTSLTGTRLTQRQMGYAASAVVLYNRATTPKAAATTYADAHYGTIKHRETFVLKVEFIGQWFASDYSDFMKRKVQFVNEDGLKFAWFTTSDFEFEVGKTYVFKATIQGHKNDKFGKYTTIGNARNVEEYTG